MITLPEIKLEINDRKTVFINAMEVADTINQPIVCLTKYFNRELGNTTQIKNNSLIINGLHTSEKVKKLLEAFIKKIKQDKIDTFNYFVKKCLDKKFIACSKVLKEAKHLDLVTEAPFLLAELLFSANIIDEIQTHAPLFLQFTYENEKAQNYLMNGIKKIILNENLQSEAVKIFYWCYHLNLIQEDYFLNWIDETEEFFITLYPFYNWLKNAQEESSDEELI